MSGFKSYINLIPICDKLGYFDIVHKIVRAQNVEIYTSKYNGPYNSGELYRIKKTAFIDPLKLEDGLQEVEVLRRVNSEFVVKLLDNWTECENTMYFQYEYYEQTLQEILELKAQTFRHSSTGTSISPLEFCISSALFTDLLEALDYLDHTRIVHRRIMPENIYLCLNKPGLKIGNFDSAVCLESVVAPVNRPENLRSNDSKNKIPVNVGKYVAPEVIRNLVCDTSADIYSAGEIAMVMFHFDLDEDTKNKVSLTDDSIPRNFIVYLYKTLLKMQSNDPKVRPTAGQILENRNHFLVDNYLNINSFDIKMFIMEHPQFFGHNFVSPYLNLKLPQ